MRNGGPSDLQTTLAAGVVGSLPGALIGVWLPVAFTLTPTLARWGVVAAFVAVAMFGGYLLRKQLGRVFGGVGALHKRNPGTFAIAFILGGAVISSCGIG